jgi:hypothetical protein
MQIPQLGLMGRNIEDEKELARLLGLDEISKNQKAAKVQQIRSYSSHRCGI